MNSCSVLVNAGQESVFLQMQSKVHHLKRGTFAALRRCEDESLPDENSTAHSSVNADHEGPLRPVIDYRTAQDSAFRIFAYQDRKSTLKLKSVYVNPIQFLKKSSLAVTDRAN